MPVTYFYSPKNFLCEAELSRDFDYAVLCAPKSAANSRVVVLCAPKSAANSRVVVLCAPKSAANSRILERGMSLNKKTGDPRHSHYIEKFQKNIST